MKNHCITISLFLVFIVLQATALGKTASAADGVS